MILNKLTLLTKPADLKYIKEIVPRNLSLWLIKRVFKFLK